MDSLLKTYFLDADKVNIDMNLALRFLRVRKEVDETTKEMLKECLIEFMDVVSYKASYRLFDIKIDGSNVHFGDEMVLESSKLAYNLRECDKAFVFVATTSVMVDRLIKKHLDLRVSKALIIDAIGSAAIESFADILCRKFEYDYKVSLRPRFSPGYGDLSILCQDDVLKVCDASRKIGVTLTENHFMVPKKSVSAIVGIRPKEEFCDKAQSCDKCESAQCPYRE